MHGSRATNAGLLDALLPRLAGLSGVECAVCVPFPYLAEVATRLAGTNVSLGAQNSSEFVSGAYTGEVAAGMLKELGCRYVLVGHSERRALYGETDVQVAAKFVAVQKAGLRPVLCVGESLSEREVDGTEHVVARQLEAVLEAAGVGAMDNAVLAYEPVWAIGTGRTATPEQAQEVHAYLRGIISTRDTEVGRNVQIVYGGSVKPANATEIFAMRDVDGGLIGGASLVAEDFFSICKAAASKE